MFNTLRQRFQRTESQMLGVVPTDELQLGKWYLAQAKQLAKSRIEARERVADVALLAVKWMGAVTIVAMAGAVTVVVIKRPSPPAVLRVDSTSGKVDVLPTTSEGKVTFGEKSVRADVRKYVEWRESYDWETIQDMHHAVLAMSSEEEGALFDRSVRSEHSPLKLLKNEARIIPKVGAITFIGSTAQVMFSRRYVPMNSAIQPDTTYWIATISYRHDNVPEKREEQDINPTGWKATSYAVTRDWSRVGQDEGVSEGKQG